MAKTAIYQLSEFQFKHLVESTNQDHSVFALLEPNPNDAPVRKSKMEQNVSDMEDLVDLGLMKDISNAFRNDIEQSIATRDRSYRVLIPTEIGFKMFRDSADRPVN